ncbi:MAG TPA: DHHA1 domain-containing protein, partial [Caldimonas sp.]
PGCGFASKHLAGVGVAFYVLLALRAELRSRAEFDLAGQPRLDALLDLVALGTVADVVRLDRNNRCLVAQGLKRIRAGRTQPGIAALFAVAGRDPREATAADFGFAIGPRLNAAGRLADMTLGIECLLSDDPERAHALAEVLDAMNRERRTLEAGMREDAQAQVDRAFALSGEREPALAVFDPSFHEGVVGIIASRLKDRLHRPSFVFALGLDGALKGSGRSIEGFHLRDALDLVSKRHPGLLLRFGGHAMAAGCTIARADLDTFRGALQRVAAEGLGADADAQTIVNDGPLAAAHFDPATVRMLEGQVWGAAFDAPLFCDTVEVLSQRLVGEKHLRLALRVDGVMREAIWFGRSDPVGERVRLAWRLGLDVYNGIERVQMIVVAAE